MIKHWLRNIDDLVASVALAGVITLTIVNVISRYVFNSPLPWTEELSISLFIWFIFIGVSSTMKRNGHVGVDYFLNKLPRNLRIIGEIIGAIAIYFTLIYVFIYLGGKLAEQAQSKVTPILGISYRTIDLAIPIGGALSLVHFTVNLVRKYQDEYRRPKEI